MASTTLISVNEYLKTPYRPDCDYVDGRIEERNVGEHDHAALEAALVGWFWQHQQVWNIEILPGQRVQVSPTRFRVPDICLVSLNEPVQQIITKPPLACIEILSPEDTMRRMQQRVEDYRSFGVRSIWILDPGTRKGYDCRPSGWLDTNEFTIEGTPIRLVLSDLFAQLRRR